MSVGTAEKSQVLWAGCPDRAVQSLLALGAYRLGFHSFSHASLAPVDFQYVLGNLENYSELFASWQRKAKLQARLLCSRGL